MSLSFSSNNQKDVLNRRTTVEKALPVKRETAAPADLEVQPGLEMETGAPKMPVILPEEIGDAAAPVISAPISPAPRPSAKDPQLVEVENILAEGLEETYKEMLPAARLKFKQEGERVSQTIWQMVKTAHLQIKKAAGLIRHWLLFIPGVNRLFLEQEVKIKTDKIIAMTKK